MREIKFRAWDSNKKRYWTQTEMTEIGGYYYTYGVEVPECEEDNFALEQFTGLQDCKGVEIYEGDIVDIYDPTTKPEPSRCVIMFNELIASFEGFVNRAPGRSLFLHGPDVDSKMKYSILRTGRTIKVIGNIHENPELLED
jgi:uncharacterized phage protein (TIGR01671 family)